MKFVDIIGFKPLCKQYLFSNKWIGKRSFFNKLCMQKWQLPRKTCLTSVSYQYTGISPASWAFVSSLSHSLAILTTPCAFGENLENQPLPAAAATATQRTHCERFSQTAAFRACGSVIGSVSAIASGVLRAFVLGKVIADKSRSHLGSAHAGWNTHILSE